MQLLISARNASEARVLASLGVDIIDLKEPDNGPLGPVSKDVLDQTGRVQRNRCSLGLTFGELIDVDSSNSLWNAQLSNFEYAKAGPAFCNNIDTWSQNWLEWAETLNTTNPGMTPVIVAYADHQNCQAPCLDEIANWAINHHARTFLIDTWSKKSGDLFQTVSLESLRQSIQKLRCSGTTVAIAGSLGIEHMQLANSIGANVFGVRGAACEEGDRTQHLSPEKVTSLLAMSRKFTTESRFSTIDRKTSFSQ